MRANAGAYRASASAGTVDAAVIEKRVGRENQTPRPRRVHESGQQFVRRGAAIGVRSGRHQGDVIRRGQAPRLERPRRAIRRGGGLGPPETLEHQAPQQIGLAEPRVEARRQIRAARARLEPAALQIRRGQRGAPARRERAAAPRRRPRRGRPRRGRARVPAGERARHRVDGRDHVAALVAELALGGAHQLSGGVDERLARLSMRAGRRQQERREGEEARAKEPGHVVRPHSQGTVGHTRDEAGLVGPASCGRPTIVGGPDRP